MKKLVIFGVMIAGLYYYFNWKPSTETVVGNMEFGDQIVHSGKVFYSDWSKKLESISGYVRRIDRHYDENIPIITYHLVITTGDYNDPNIVEVRHQGGGNYFWSAKTKPSGSIIFYHTIPNSTDAQRKLDDLSEGDTIEIEARVSNDNEIRNETRALFKLRHSNHKILLVEDIK